MDVPRVICAVTQLSPVVLRQLKQLLDYGDLFGVK